MLIPPLSPDAENYHYQESHPNLMLRQEMSGHIHSLKTILGATALGDGSGDYNLAALTANIQQVTTEARSLTAAKIELETALARIGQTY